MCAGRSSNFRTAIRDQFGSFHDRQSEADDRSGNYQVGISNTLGSFSKLYVLGSTHASYFYFILP